MCQGHRAGDTGSSQKVNPVVTLAIRMVLVIRWLHVAVCDPPPQNES